MTEKNTMLIKTHAEKASTSSFLCEIFNPDSNRGYNNLQTYVKCKWHDQVAIPPLVVNNSTISESQEKANVINQ